MANVKPVSDADGSLLQGLVSRKKPTSTANERSATASSVLRMVLYFDVFAHPLRRSELERFVCPGEPARVAEACSALAREGHVETHEAWVSAPGRMATLPARKERARWAEAAWPKAQQAARLLARLPHVEGLFVTGGLSKNSAKPGDDIDFLVLTAPGRVWTLKTFLQVLRRPLPSAWRERLCTNYLVSTDSLLLDDRNLFTAVELATAVPVFGRKACVAFLEANAWASAFVPGLSWSVARAQALELHPVRPSTPPSALGRAAEQLGLSAWNAYWNHKYRWLSSADRDQRFKRTPERATNHLHDFQSYVLGEVATRLQAAGSTEQLVQAGARP